MCHSISIAVLAGGPRVPASASDRHEPATPARQAAGARAAVTKGLRPADLGWDSQAKCGNVRRRAGRGGPTHVRLAHP
jgi:hypothetical protein